jgi:NAD(P)-dependent dehydrogenase (short-subunit alcohol dehydrogenase family)
VLITGTSIGGIGFEAARVMAKHANLVIVTGYNPERH